MSLKQAILSCNNPHHRILGAGLERIAFYSPTYDCVFKRSRVGACSYQQAIELHIIANMTYAERAIFPVESSLFVGGKQYIIMKKCVPLTKRLDGHASRVLIGYLLEHIQPNPNISFYESCVSEIIDRLHLDRSYIQLLANFIKRFLITDIYSGNLGIYNNRLVILDCGFSRYRLEDFEG